MRLWIFGKKLKASWTTILLSKVSALGRIQNKYSWSVSYLWIISNKSNNGLLPESKTKFMQTPGNAFSKFTSHYFNKSYMYVMNTPCSAIIYSKTSVYVRVFIIRCGERRVLRRTSCSKALFSFFPHLNFLRHGVQSCVETSLRTETEWNLSIGMFFDISL